MLNKIVPLSIAIALAALLTPTQVDAYGAAHVGYTHVGPNGVQHYGATAVATPHGDYSTAHYGAYGAGGGEYHAGYGAGDHDRGLPLRRRHPAITAARSHRSGRWHNLSLRVCQIVP